MRREPALARWTDAAPPTEEAVLQRFREEGLMPQAWSNGPYAHYSPHRHAYHKVLYAVRGSITFVTHPDRQRYELRAGDRLDLPPGTEHSADVGPEGVACIEAPRYG
jgi:quercetin dioxygenase-like cupin family protein